MNPDEWRRVTTVFHAALEHSPAARDAFLDEACSAEPGLRAEVDRLLAAHDRMGNFGEVPLVPPSDPSDPSHPSDPSDTDDDRAGASDPAGVEARRGGSGPPRRRSWFAWLAWIAAVVTAVVFTYAGILLVDSGGRVPEFGWDEVRRDGRWFVSTVDPDGPASGRLGPGDEVLGVDGGPVFHGLGTIPYRRSLSIGDTYQLAIDRRGERLEPVLSVSEGPSRLAPRLTYFFVTLVWCVVGLFIGLARPERPEARLACAASWTTGLGFLHAVLLSGGPLFNPLHVILGYHFFCRFPTGRPTAGIRRWSLGLLYGLVAVPILLGLWFRVTLYTGGVADAAELVTRHPWVMGLRRPLIPYLYYAALALTVTVAAVGYRRLENEDQRRRVQWLVLGALVGLTPQVVWSAAEIVAGVAATAWLETPANLFTGLIPLSAAYAVAKHRVFDIRVVVRRSLRYLLARRVLQASVALPLVALLYTLVRNRELTLIQLVGETRAYLLWLGAAALMLAVRVPLRRWLDRRFFREEYDREQLLLGILEDVGKVDSIPELTHLVHERLTSALHPTAAYVWYRDPDELALASSSNPLLTPVDVPSDGPWLPWLERRGGATALPLPAEAGLSRREARWFCERSIALAVPIMDSADRMVGAVLLGEKRSEQPYNPGDLTLLNAIARQVAVVRENLRLRARVGEEVRVKHEVLARIGGRISGLLKECPRCGACFDGPVERCPRDSGAVALSLPVPRTIDGRYRLDRRLGRGGMGAVYEARDLQLERDVAVKVLLGRPFGRRAAQRRFHREARAAARVNHPNIVAVHDFGALEGDGAYLVMERIRGVTLRVQLQHATPMPTVHAARWFDPLLAGLAAAHEAGIVHRDLKPENVMGVAEPSGVRNVKILDLGLAKFHAAERLTDDAVTGSFTTVGTVMGTLAYMAPEQLAGRPVDPRTDLFSVGVMLVEALTGRQPLSAMDAERSRTLARWSRHVRGPSSHVEALEGVLRRCLAEDPHDRFRSADSLRHALIPVLRACPPLAAV